MDSAIFRMNNVAIFTIIFNSDQFPRRGDDKHFHNMMPPPPCITSCMFLLIFGQFEHVALIKRRYFLSDLSTFFQDI